MMGPSSTLADFQHDFMRALTGGPDDMPVWASQPGFAIYRNTVMKGCLDALEANFPAVARLVGSDWFRSAAALHVAEHLPVDPRLMRYGDQFPAFLERFAPAQDWPYLAGVARLDRHWTESHLAADAPAVDTGWLARLAPENLATTRLCPHPATRWAWFADQPVVSIWTANREVLDEVAAARALADLQWRGEAALLTRAQGVVTGSIADLSTCAFLDACAAGADLAEAASAAVDAQADVDVAHLLSTLLQRGALCTENHP